MKMILFLVDKLLQVVLLHLKMRNKSYFLNMIILILKRLIRVITLYQLREQYLLYIQTVIVLI